MVSVLAAVAAQKDGFTSLTEILPGVGFHALAMLAGTVLLTMRPKEKQFAPA
jgi:hypothetical protein